MERFFSQIIEGVTEAARTLGEAFGETDDDTPATSTADNAGCLECDDDQLKAIAEDYNQVGDARLNKDEFADALDFYTKGIELKCNDDQLNATMYTNRARVNFCVGNFDEALNDVRSAREFQPLHLEAIELGASTCMELGLYKEVIKWCDEGLAINNRSKKLRDLKSRSMKIQAHQDLEIDDDTLLRGIADGHNKDGDEELRKIEFVSAIDCYTEGIEVKCKDDRLNAVLYTNRATVHSLVGNYDDALRDAKCARKFQPTFVKAILTGARACFELAMFEEAVTWCNDGLAIDKEEKTMLELRERSLIELCHLRKEEDVNASTSSQSNLGLF